MPTDNAKVFDMTSRDVNSDNLQKALLSGLRIAPKTVVEKTPRDEVCRLAANDARRCSKLDQCEDNDQPFGIKCSR